MTELFCPQGHTVNPGGEVCSRCGAAAVSPIVPSGEATAEQLAAATGTGDQSDSAQDDATTGDQAANTDASANQQADGNQDEQSGTDNSQVDEGAPTGEAPGDLASQMAADQAKE